MPSNIDEFTQQKSLCMSILPILLLLPDTKTPPSLEVQRTIWNLTDKHAVRQNSDFAWDSGWVIFIELEVHIYVAANLECQLV